ncbi:Methicillin resistance protein [Catenulispora acidiphila DSM 44928]|uniref:Methicillin resistance protein n=1 Tax=Catenulispora acidiphila (strain DSM 44928 / JCM 14897 / NBRC 102108 / NRRL B-24433 / ID139908) TaxID=479433 RepID=C7PVD7_CATAD|nr:peptidoglycan bridge formation glycyltransferase FemA/FemB family protein [Catenulispora acidiphila]ACU69293.1 Methicillin resistance protein [Catenulispora acidiphila DSM 44928]
MVLRVRTLSREEHVAFIEERTAEKNAATSVSFLQCPSWGDLKTDWRAESVGWVEDASGEVVGAALVLYRDVPIPKRDKLPFLRRSLAYLPEGPILDLTSADAGQALKLLVAHLRKRRAFTVKMGPQMVSRRWTSETLKKAIAETEGGVRLKDIKPDFEDPTALSIIEKLRATGWSRKESEGAGFGDFQPRYVFQLPLVDESGKPRTLEDIQKGFNQLWRRNIKKADKNGVEVTLGGYDDLAEFHKIYEVTAVRDHFTPRPLAYFQRMWKAMEAENPNRLRLYLARHEGELLAATTLVTVGDHAWYSYGASADHKRELRPSNAIQWRMLSDSHASGCKVYDLRGISDTLDPNDHLFGLIQFKLGTGGQAVEYLGEWDYALNPVLHRAFEMYMARR